MTIIYPPTIVTHPATQNQFTGLNVDLNVEANGTMPFTYQWQRADSNGTWHDLIGATEDTYTLQNVQLSDTGSFRVIVSNFLATPPVSPPRSPYCKSRPSPPIR